MKLNLSLSASPLSSAWALVFYIPVDGIIAVVNIIKLLHFSLKSQI